VERRKETKKSTKDVMGDGGLEESENLRTGCYEFWKVGKRGKWLVKPEEQNKPRNRETSNVDQVM